jgi:hypothetical protein
MPIDPRDIENWSERPEAKDGLPALIRLLALATAILPVNVNIPSGSSINLPGWDGRFESKGGPFIPDGKVVFEMSCGSDPEAKADENYKKRTEEPLGVNLEETTFIFVSARVWVGAEAWANARAAEGKWKAVKAYDATLLAQWLETSPAAASSFSRGIGVIPPSGYITLSEYWETWSKMTEPACVPSLLTGGRDEQIQRIKKWASEDASKFFVQAEMKDEAVAFLAAWAMSDEDVGELVLARSIVVKSLSAWNDLSRSKSPLFLIPDFTEDYSATVAIDNGHHVFTPLETGQKPSGAGSPLSRLDRDSFLAALKKMGVSEPESTALANNTGRNLPTLRRKLMDHPGVQKPSWTQGASARTLLPALLLGQWTGKEDDLAALSELAGRPATEVLADYQAFLQAPDSPLRKVGDHWRLTSHDEAWELLAPLLSEPEINRFVPLARDVFSELAPALDMEKDERYLAGVKGKVLVRSDVVREGVASTLALMGCRSESLRAEISSIPLRVIRDVMDARATDWRFWATANSELSTLMEAAPDELLSGMEAALNADPSPFLEIFKQEGGGFWGTCYHSGILWALERAALSAEHFARAAIILARLTEIDPGGTYANRPLESLRALFLGWRRFSDLPDNERLKVLDTLCTRVPEAGWKVLMEINPSSFESITEWQYPSYRPWGQTHSRVPTHAEYGAFLQEVVTRVMKYIGEEPNHWETATEHLASFPPDERSQLLEKLETVIPNIPDLNIWTKVREKMRSVLSHHRAYPDMDWAMPVENTDRLGKLYDALAPTDPIHRDGWVFEYWVDMPEGGRRTDEDAQVAAEDLRKSTFIAVYEQMGKDGIKRLITESPNAGPVGRTAGKYFDDKSEVREVLFEYLATESFHERAYAGETASAIFAKGGWNVLELLIKDARAAGVSDAGIGHLYLAADFGKEAWDRLKEEPEESQRYYWANLWNHVLARVADAADYEYAVGRLLDYNRAPDVIDAMAYGREEIPAHLLIRALELAPKNLAADSAAGRPIRVSSHDIARAFEKLEQSAGAEESVIARLEVPYVRMLHLERPHLVLHREVAHDPTTFADLVSWVYKRSDGESEDDGVPADEREGRAIMGWSILHSVSVLPGQKVDGSIDATTQLAWVQEAKRLCVERGRDVVGRQNIGQVLGYAPVGSDGIWPHESVRATLDAMSDSEIGEGFVIRKQNLRGATSRGMYDGGAIERKLEEGHRKDAEQLRSEYPFTARLLNDLADAYKREAERHDEDSAWMDK